MPRQPASTYRFGHDTDARIEWLAQHLELSATDVIRQAVRRLYNAEKGPPRKPAKPAPAAKS